MKRFLTAIALLAFSVRADAAETTLPAATQAFLAKHCFECHGAKTQEGKLRLDNVTPDFASSVGAAAWGKVYSKLGIETDVQELLPEDGSAHGFDKVSSALTLSPDSTRLITLMIQGHNSVPPVQGITVDWHNLSHHGKDPDKLAQLRVIELEQMKLLAGGDFQHGQHLAFDVQRNYPLPNLFVSMLQRLGIPDVKFGSSSGSLRRLELA